MSNQGDWLRPPADLKLQNHEVHVWRAALDRSPELTQFFAKSLSADEQTRADRFRFEQHRQRFITGRGILRSLLGRYLQIAPDQLQFNYSDKGKPALANQTLQFNLAHSQGLALIAVSLDRPVGVDLEQIRAIADLNLLTQRFFSLTEHAAICNLPLDQQPKAFFRYWTCKEAYLKATGDGLSKLKGLEISLESSRSACLANVSQNEWHLQELAPAEGFVGAIVAFQQDWHLTCWHLALTKDLFHKR